MNDDEKRNAARARLRELSKERLEIGDRLADAADAFRKLHKEYSNVAFHLETTVAGDAYIRFVTVREFAWLVPQLTSVTS